MSIMLTPQRFARLENEIVRLKAEANVRLAKAEAEIERLQVENDVLRETCKWRYEVVLQLKEELRRALEGK